MSAFTTAPVFRFVSASSGSYKQNQTISINVVFSEPVVVSGTPSITLNTGVDVNYTSGTGSNTLLFQYTVGSSHNASPLSVGSMQPLNSATIKDVAGNDFTGTSTVTGVLSGVIVDTAAPTISTVSVASLSVFSTGTA